MKYQDSSIKTMITIATNNYAKTTAKIHAQTAHIAQLATRPRSFYAKQTQFAQCSNKRKYCCNNGLAKYLTLPKPVKTNPIS